MIGRVPARQGGVTGRLVAPTKWYGISLRSTGGAVTGRVVAQKNKS